MKRFWTVAELADLFGVPKTWIYERTRSGGPDLIPHVKLGRYIRFEPESENFRRWLQNHEVVSEDLGSFNAASPDLYSRQPEQQDE